MRAILFTLLKVIILSFITVFVFAFIFYDDTPESEQIIDTPDETHDTIKIQPQGI